MTEFVARAAELQATGLRILALSVDGIGTDPGSVEDAVAAVRDRQFPFLAARATPRLLELFEAMRAELFSHEQPYPVPTSFLIDTQGRVNVIYVGPVTVDQLLMDLPKLQLDDAAFREFGAPLAGRWLTPATPIRLKPIADALREFGLEREAQWYQQQAGPQMALSHCQLALEAERRVELTTAAGHLREALSLAPQSAPVRAAVGEYWVRRRDLNQARQHFLAAVELEPNAAEHHVRLANLDLLAGRRDAAEAGLKRAIALDDTSARAHTLLGRLLQNGDPQRAAEHLQKAVSLDPQLAAAHVYLGVVRVQQRRLAEAEASFRAALATSPELVDAQENLANVLMAQGKTAEAIGAFQETLRLRPQAHGAAMKLAWCLATAPDDRLRSGNEALQLANRVVEVTRGTIPHPYDVLAAAHAELGQFDQAVAAATRAVELAEKARLPAASAFRQRLDLYRQKLPYRAAPLK
jgi:tetratricopeptide (TPR) repeat protein